MKNLIMLMISVMFLMTPMQTFAIGDGEMEADSKKDAQHNEERELYLITYKDKKYKNIDEIKKNGGKIHTDYNNLSTIATYLPKQALNGLLKNPNIIAIEDNKKVFMDSGLNSYGLDDEDTVAYDNDYTTNKNWGLEVVNSKKANNAGYDGSGVNVAILDTGVYPNHPEFKESDGTDKVKEYVDCYTILEYETYSSSCDNSTKYNGSHGTMDAGIVGGNDVGVAPGVNLYSVKVTDNGSPPTPYLDDVLRGLNWAIDSHNDSDSTNDIDIINMSLQTGKTTAFDNALTTAYTSGILLVSSAGNIKTENET